MKSTYATFERPSVLLRRQSRLGIGFNTALLPYGDELRLHRKFYHHALNEEVSAEYYDLYLRKAYQLVVSLLQNTHHELGKCLEMFVNSP